MMNDEIMDKELARAIGKAARDARQGLELTQEDAADRIGVSAEFYARIERGNALPSVQTLARISSSLGVRADELIGRAEPTPRSKDAAAKLKAAAQAPSDPPEVRRVLRRLRRAGPGTVRLVAMLIKELERRR